MSKEKVLVTGGAGFIGFHTTEKLIEKGYEVTVFDNLSTGNIRNLFHKNADVKFILGDLRIVSDVENAVKDKDYIIHLGACLSVPESMTKPELYQDTNVQGTFNLLHSASKTNVKKVVLASSCAVEGDSYYGLSKKITEDIANWFIINSKLSTACLRYVNVYGERQAVVGEGAVVPAFINLLLNKESPIVHGNGLQTRDYIYVKDVADANVHAIENDFTGITYIATNSETSVLTLLRAIKTLMNVDIPHIYKPRREGDMMNVGIHYPKKEFKWEPQFTLEEGLKKTIEWLKNEKQS